MNAVLKGRAALLWWHFCGATDPALLRGMNAKDWWFGL